MRKVNHNPLRNGLALLKKFEGLRLCPYKDVSGNYTVGYGHKLRSGESRAPITEKLANDYLLRDYQYFVDYLIGVLPNLNDCEICALAVFCYNIGIKWLNVSTNLGREVIEYNKDHSNKSRLDHIKAWLLQYCRCRDSKTGEYRTLNGLLLRRKAEADFLFGNYIVKQSMY